MTWDIIIWTRENAIDYVPSVWANGDHTFYKYPVGLSESKIREAIYECLDLQNYRWCEAILKKKNVGDLKKAKRLCKEGQYTSNIETDSESSIDTGRDVVKKRKKTKRLIEEDSSDDDIRANAPSQVKGMGANSQTRFKKIFEYPRVNLPDDLPETASEVNSTVPLPRTSPLISSANKGNIERILRNQMEIKYELKEIRKKLEEFENTNIFGAGSGEMEIRIFDKLLPCNTVANLNELEQLITEEKTFNDLAMVVFYKIGGDSLQRNVQFIMKKLLTNQLALAYSGQGKKHKLPFCSLRVFKAIIVAVTKRFTSATEEDIKKAVSLYLAQAKARMRISSSTVSQDDSP